MNFNFITNDVEVNILKSMDKIFEDNIGSDIYTFDGHDINDDCIRNNFTDLDADIIHSTSNSILHRIFNEDISNISYEQIKPHVSEIIKIEMDQVYYCGRDWSAWGYNTMTGDDFVKFIQTAEFEGIVELLTKDLVNNIIQAEKEFITKDINKESLSSKNTKRL